MSLETLPLPSPEKHSMSLCFFFFFSLQSTSRSSLYSKTLLLGKSSFKFRVWQGESMCDRVRVWEKENEKERARDEERKIKETVWTVEEEFLKNKNMIRLARSVNGDGDTCVEEKKQEEKKKKRKRNVWTEGEEV